MGEPTMATSTAADAAATTAIASGRALNPNAREFRPREPVPCEGDGDGDGDGDGGEVARNFLVAFAGDVSPTGTGSNSNGPDDPATVAKTRGRGRLNPLAREFHPLWATTVWSGEGGAAAATADVDFVARRRVSPFANDAAAAGAGAQQAFAVFASSGEASSADSHSMPGATYPPSLLVPCQPVLHPYSPGVYYNEVSASTFSGTAPFGACTNETPLATYQPTHSYGRDTFSDTNEFATSFSTMGSPTEDGPRPFVEGTLRSEGNSDPAGPPVTAARRGLQVEAETILPTASSTPSPQPSAENAESTGEVNVTHPTGENSHDLNSTQRLIDNNSGGNEGGENERSDLVSDQDLDDDGDEEANRVGDDEFAPPAIISASAAPLSKKQVLALPVTCYEDQYPAESTSANEPSLETMARTNSFAPLFDDDSEDEDDDEEEGTKAFCVTCAICRRDFDRQEKVRLLPKCGHCFHTECISHWLTKARGCCPLCRTPVLSAFRPSSPLPSPRRIARQGQQRQVQGRWRQTLQHPLIAAREQEHAIPRSSGNPESSSGPNALSGMSVARGEEGRGTEDAPNFGSASVLTFRPPIIRDSDNSAADAPSFRSMIIPSPPPPLRVFPQPMFLLTATQSSITIQRQQEDENVLRALEIANFLLKKDRLDAQLLGTESLCLLTDPARKVRFNLPITYPLLPGLGGDVPSSRSSFLEFVSQQGRGLGGALPLNRGRRARNRAAARRGFGIDEREERRLRRSEGRRKNARSCRPSKELPRRGHSRRGAR